MKTLPLTVLFFLMTVAVLAQSPSMNTLFSSRSQSGTAVTAYGALVAKGTRFADSPALLTGVYGGVMLNHRFLIGAGGYGLTTNVWVPNEQVNGQPLRWEMNYYGLLLEYVSRPQGVFHLTGNVLAGGGYVRKNRLKPDDQDDDDLSWKRHGFYALEPSLGVEVNAFRWMRLEVGGSYRFVFDSRTPGLTDRQMSAPAYHATLKFGKF